MTNLNCIYNNVSVSNDGPKHIIKRFHSYSTTLCNQRSQLSCRQCQSCAQDSQALSHLGDKVTSASISSGFDFGQDPDFFGQIGPDKVRVLLKSLDSVRDCSKVWIPSGIAQKSGFFMK